jgi:hypothetical protein
LPQQRWQQNDTFIRFARADFLELGFEARLRYLLMPIFADQAPR